MIDCNCSCWYRTNDEQLKNQKRSVMLTHWRQQQVVLQFHTKTKCETRGAVHRTHLSGILKIENHSSSGNLAEDKCPSINHRSSISSLSLTFKSLKDGSLQTVIASKLNESLSFIKGVSQLNHGLPWSAVLWQYLLSYNDIIRGNEESLFIT